MFPGVSGARSDEGAGALDCAGPLSEAGRLQVETYGASVAGFRALGAPPAAIAEHSMGIYAALTAAGVWTFEDGARVVGEASRCLDAAPPGGVAVCVGLPLARIEELCRETGVALANENSEVQHAVGGPPEALDAFERAARAAAAYDVVRVPLAGAVHTPWMAEATRRMAAFLRGVPMRAPEIPFVSHVDAEWIDDPEVIRVHVAEALSKPVRWRPVVERLLREGFEAFVDVGPGDVLAKLVKWVNRSAKTASVSVDLAAARRVAART